MGNSHIVHKYGTIMPPYNMSPNAIIANLDSLYQEAVFTNITLSEARRRLPPITTAASHILPQLPPDVAETFYYNVRHREDAILNVIANR